MTEAHKEKDEFKQKNDTFDAEHAALLKKASDGADVEGKRLMDAARAAADALAAKRRDALKTDEEKSRRRHSPPNQRRSVRRRAQGAGRPGRRQPRG